MTPEEVIDVIKRSGPEEEGAEDSHRIKVGVTAKSKDDQKYVCCNADEAIRAHLWTEVYWKAILIQL
jgi:NADP-reducing hydrogenase subunit HndC